MIGRRLSHFEIEAEIGAGGMGVVYCAKDLRLLRSVALKVLPPQLLADPSRRERFLREARAASALNHPNIVTVYEVDTSEGVDFIAMEYLEGKSLDQVIGAGGLDPGRALRYARQIAEGLAAAHGRGITHRDVKPRNILVTLDDTVKILDFGLAKVIAPQGADSEAVTESKITGTGHVLGTVAYMSPEQARGQKLDARSDIFSFGIVFYEMLAGQGPFRGQSAAEVLSAILRDTPPPLRRARPDLPEGIERIVGKALEKDLDYRYQDMREVLADLKRLERDAGPVDPVPNNLPVQLTSFVGRGTEMAELCQAIGERRLISLTGAGGCGKTRLAVHVAALMTDRHPDGTWWVELAPVTSPDLVPYTMARALGLHEEAGRSLLDTLGAQLCHLNALVVLDNCEHVLDACAQLVVHLLQLAPKLRIITTSREPLGIPGELPWRVPSLDDEAATRLFVERAAEVRGGFAPDAATIEVVRGICRRLDGIPLAIELAAARTRMMSPPRIATALDDRFRLLTGGGRGLMPRQQTLETSVAWSYDLLDDTERLLLRRLSVFAGGFTLEAAESVSSGELIDQRAVLDLLGGLIDKSLVQAGSAETADRYRLLETIRLFARDRLAESGESSTTRDRHRDFFAALTETAEPELALADGPTWLARLEADHDNLRAALEWAETTGKRELLLRMVGALTLFFELRGHLGEGGRWFGRALAGEGEASAIRARALWGSAHVASYAGDYATASERAPQALAMAKAVGDDRARARALNNLAFVQMWTEPAAAREAFAESIQLGRQSGDNWAVADGVKMSTVCWLCQDDYDGLQDPLDELLRVAAQFGNRFFRAWYHISVGWASVRRGNLDTARSALATSLEQCHEVGEPVTAGFAIAFLGEIATLTGQYADGTARIEAFLQRANATGGGIAVPWAVIVRATLALAGGDAGAACAIIDPLVEEMRTLGLPLLLSHALAVRGAARLAASGEATAGADFREARQVASSIDNQWLIALADHSLGQLARQQHQPNRAQDLLHDALALRATHKWLPGVVDSLEALAGLAAEQGSYLEATRIFGAALTLRNAIGVSRWPAEQSGYEAILARIRAELGETDFATAWAEGEALSAEEAVAYASRTRGERKRPS